MRAGTTLLGAPLGVNTAEHESTYVLSKINMLGHADVRAGTTLLGAPLGAPAT